MLENFLQAFLGWSVVRSTELDIDFERKIVAILALSVMQLASSNNLRDNALLDISPLLDSITKVPRFRNND